ncbi:hypothetical protein DLJ49_20125 [Rhodovulum sp. 12E13]|uniref:hypothetical protein n=1 Tax=Rhodovulum sp. 12E13 TaxID=2203891 RepID=UPI000E196147|nr:hypothetical protein [Rhodovulum sp. 12E13]RDC68081.1 hypothetical protein DLJ49_20125 [Rhodovulum sp. 12E13]
MDDDFEWGPWLPHDDSGWPPGVEPDEVVLAEIRGDAMPPMPACRLDWHCPGDPVTRYRRREWKALDEVDALEEVTA